MNVTLAHQCLAQVPEAMQEAVFGNVGNLIAFQVGSIDAERIAKEFCGFIPASNLVNLNKFEAYVRAVRDGEVQNPYLLKTAPPMTLRNQLSERLVSRSRERFAIKRSEVEPKLAN